MEGSEPLTVCPCHDITLFQEESSLCVCVCVCVLCVCVLCCVCVCVSEREAAYIYMYMYNVHVCGKLHVALVRAHVSLL